MESEAPGGTVLVSGSFTKAWLCHLPLAGGCTMVPGPLSVPNMCTTHSFALAPLRQPQKDLTYPLCILRKGSNTLSLAAW